MSQHQAKYSVGRWTFFVGIGMSLLACNAPAVTDLGRPEAPAAMKKEGLPITILHHESYAICPDGSMESGLNLFDDARSWQGFVKASAQRAPQLVEWKPNFASSRVLVFRLGSKTSGGYSVRAVAASQNSKDNELALYLRAARPQLGSLNTSALTAPCLVATLASVDFKSVSVIDSSDGTVLGKIQQ
jgi:hypothetical protein